MTFDPLDMDGCLIQFSFEFFFALALIIGLGICLLSFFLIIITLAPLSPPPPSCSIKLWTCVVCVSSINQVALWQRVSWWLVLRGTRQNPPNFQLSGFEEALGKLWMYSTEYTGAGWIPSIVTVAGGRSKAANSLRALQRGETPVICDR